MPPERGWAAAGQANLADIAARTSAQQVVSDNLGLMGAVAVSAFVRNMPRTRALMPFALYPVLAGTDLACIHAELKVVQLKTINKVRARLRQPFSRLCAASREV